MRCTELACVHFCQFEIRACFCYVEADTVLICSECLCMKLFRILC